MPPLRIVPFGRGLRLMVCLMLWFTGTGAANLMAQTDYYAPQARWQFARESFRFGDYESTVYELQQLRTHLTLDNSTGPLSLDSLHYWMARSYFRLDSLSGGFDALKQISDRDSALSAWASTALAWQTFETHPKLPVNTDFGIPAGCVACAGYERLLRMGIALRLRAYASFDSLFRTAPPPTQFELNEAHQRLQDLRTQSRLQRRHSPWLAGGLALVLPGAGKAYLGRWGHAASYLLMAAALGLQAWEGHYRGSDLQLYTFSGLFTLFHATNVYLSIAEAQLFNRRQKQQYLAEVGLAVRIPFRVWLRR